MSLRSRVEEFIAYRADLQELIDLLRECSADGSLEALLCVRRLAEDMYGGFTFNYELKAPAAWELACWGEPGIDQLLEMAKQSSTSKNESLCVQILCGLASGLSEKSVFVQDTQFDQLRQLLEECRQIVDYARGKLVEFVLSIEDEGDVVDIARKGFGYSFSRSALPAREMFAAMAARWLAISAPVIHQYQKLISEKPDDEVVFQKFLSKFPQLLDPMAVDVWPQPDLHGVQEPDFLIRRSDNSYVVVEIETPSKQIITQGNQLGSQATHAVAQATEYKRFIERLPNAQMYFPDIDELACLVVIGLERNLNSKQIQALRNDNGQRQALKIVGFDWLAERALNIQRNIIRTGVRIHIARVT